MTISASAPAQSVVGPLTFDDQRAPLNGNAHDVAVPGFLLTGGFVTYKTSNPGNRFYKTGNPRFCAGCTIPFVLYTVAGARNLTIDIVSAEPVARVVDGGRTYYAGAGQTIRIDTSTGVTYISYDGPAAFPDVAVDNIWYERPATVRFALDDESDANARKVLIARHRNDMPYPSPAHIADGRMHVRANAGAPGKRVYFRVVDPPDTAPYVPIDERKANDNVGGLARLTVYDAVSDAAGDVSTELIITDRYAGDNYRVEASTAPAFACAPNCPRSGVFTAWKRVYLENDSMYRRGSFVAKRTTLRDRVAVTDITPFLGQEGKTFEIIHAGDPMRPSARTLHRERHTIGRAVRWSGGDGGEIELVPGDMLQHSYGASVAKPLLSDAVGLITGDPARDYFSTSDALARSLFAQAFVEYVPLEVKIPVVPRIESLTDSAGSPDWIDFAAKWSESDPAPNHQHVISATKIRNPRTRNVPETRRAEATTIGGYSYMYVYVEDVGSNQVLLSEIVAHEIAHLWHTNPKAKVEEGEHCAERQWEHRGRLCQAVDGYECQLPSGSYDTCREFEDGAAAFHYKKNPDGVDSEYRWIRERCEPIPNERPILAAWWSRSPLPCR